MKMEPNQTKKKNLVAYSNSMQSLNFTFQNILEEEYLQGPWLYQNQTITKGEDVYEKLQQNIWLMFFLKKNTCIWLSIKFNIFSVCWQIFKQISI